MDKELERYHSSNTALHAALADATKQQAAQRQELTQRFFAMQATATQMRCGLHFRSTLLEQGVALITQDQGQRPAGLAPCKKGCCRGIHAPMGVHTGWLNQQSLARASLLFCCVVQGNAGTHSRGCRADPVN